MEKSIDTQYSSINIINKVLHRQCESFKNGGPGELKSNMKKADLESSQYLIEKVSDDIAG